MSVFVFGMTLAGLLLGSAAEVTTPLLRGFDFAAALFLIIGAIASLFKNRA